MKKCTKGKMKAGKINCGQFPISIDGRHFAIIKFTHLIDMEQDEANAKEFVRRWNAFEDGGIVEELRTACEEFMKAWNQPTTRSMFQLKIDMDIAYEKLEAALAKS